MASGKKFGKKINEALKLNGKHVYYYHLGNWYHHLREFPGVLVDKGGYVKFETKEDYDNHPMLKHNQRLHIKHGISSISTYKFFSEEELYILNRITSEKNADSDEATKQAERKPKNIDSIIRNQSNVRKVKRLRNDTCQICSLQLKIGKHSTYSEVHHIKPLGKPHNGPDDLSNMICVCPNCHKVLDYGFVIIDEKDIENIKEHVISKKYIAYHNAKVKKYRFKKS